MTTLVMHIYSSNNGTMFYGPPYEVIGKYQIYKSNAVIPRLNPLATITLKC